MYDSHSSHPRIVWLIIDAKLGNQLVLRISAFPICHHCLDVHSDVNNPPIDLSVCGLLGQCLAHHRCPVSIIKRMNECQRLAKRRKESTLASREALGKELSCAPSSLTATNSEALGLERQPSSATLSFKLMREKAPTNYNVRALARVF